jgi:hypothetical protein
MGAQGSRGGESVAPTRSQATLDNWKNFQNRRRCSLRRGYHSARYRDIANNREYTLPPTIVPLSEYLDYNKDVLLFGHALEPIEEDKTWRLVGGNTNGIKPYGGAADLISVLERLKLLQLLPFKKQIWNGITKDIGMNFKNFWSRPLVHQGWIEVQQNISLKHRRLNQEGLQVLRWGKWCIAW